MKIMKLLLCAYALPIIAMQGQNPSFLIDNTKSDVQRKSVIQLQTSIRNLQCAIDNVKGLEDFPSEEDVTFLERFKIKLALNEQALAERYKQQSDLVKSDYKNLA